MELSIPKNLKPFCALNKTTLGESEPLSNLFYLLVAQAPSSLIHTPPFLNTVS